MRFRRLPWNAERVFVSSLAGDWLLMDHETFKRLVRHELPADDPVLRDLQARHLVVTDPLRSTLAPLLSQYRTRKSYLLKGPALHIIVARNLIERRSLSFVLASTLHDLSNEQLAFFKEHRFKLSTSLDGPEWLHNANRPRPERDSYRRTLDGIERGRAALGDDAVSALTTLTRKSLEAPEAIIDEYHKLGFHSISLRPLSPYGFALKTRGRTGYTMDEFLSFYGKALEHLLAINRSGYRMEETYASLLLSQLFSPFSHGYVDLRSPTGAGFGAMIYDYNGQVYPSDEARMLAAMGEGRFSLGRVEQPIETWLASPAMRALAEAGVAEALPTCSDCAYVPLCGADPVDHFARQGDTVGHRPTSEFCRRQMGLLDLLLERYEQADQQDRAILENWVFHSGIAQNEAFDAAA